MYARTVSSPFDSSLRQFRFGSKVVAFAGSRRGSLPEPVTSSLVHAFYAMGHTFLTGCAQGVDGCFRQALTHHPFEQHAMVACAFEYRTRRFPGLFSASVVPAGLSPAAALHR